MDPITIVFLIILIPFIILTIRSYFRHRKELDKKERDARLEGLEYIKPSVADDTKSCLLVILIIVIIVIGLVLIYPILSWLAPNMFPRIHIN